MSDIFVETYTAEYGTLQVTDEATCLFVRDEKTYTARSSGSVDRVVKSGRLMRSGAHIVSVGNSAYYSDRKGIISYYYDGLETAYTPENMETIPYTSLEKAKESPVSKSPAKDAVSGDVVYKIVDNQEWFLICWLGQEEAAKYQEGRRVIIDFKDGKDGKDGKEGTQLETEVYRLIPQGERTMMILSCNRYYEDFDKYRTKDCTLIASKTSGIFLETSSIVEEDGRQGVYVVDKLENYHFTPICILRQDGDVTVVEKNYFYDAKGNSVRTVQNYDNVLRPEAKDDEQSADEKDINSDPEDKKE
jgi:putative membrane fusion protein